MGYRLENVEKQRAIANAPNDPRSGENAYFRAIFVIALFLFAFSQSRAVFYSLRALSDTGHRRLFCNPASKSISASFSFFHARRAPRDFQQQLLSHLKCLDLRARILHLVRRRPTQSFFERLQRRVFEQKVGRPPLPPSTARSNAVFPLAFLANGSLNGMNFGIRSRACALKAS